MCEPSSKKGRFSEWDLFSLLRDWAQKAGVKLLLRFQAGWKLPFIRGLQSSEKSLPHRQINLGGEGKRKHSLCGDSGSTMPCWSLQRCWKGWKPVVVTSTAQFLWTVKHEEHIRVFLKVRGSSPVLVYSGEVMSPHVLWLHTPMNQNYHQAYLLIKKKPNQTKTLAKPKKLPASFLSASLTQQLQQIWNLKESIQWKPAITWIWDERQFVFCHNHWEQSSRIMDRAIYFPTNTFSPSVPQPTKPF